MFGRVPASHVCPRALLHKARRKHSMPCLEHWRVRFTYLMTMHCLSPSSVSVFRRLHGGAAAVSADEIVISRWFRRADGSHSNGESLACSVDLPRLPAQGRWHVTELFTARCGSCHHRASASTTWHRTVTEFGHLPYQALWRSRGSKESNHEAAEPQARPISRTATAGCAGQWCLHSLLDVQ
jgi:hypothetical protein